MKQQQQQHPQRLAAAPTSTRRCRSLLPLTPSRRMVASISPRVNPPFHRSRSRAGPRSMAALAAATDASTPGTCPGPPQTSPESRVSSCFCCSVACTPAWPTGQLGHAGHGPARRDCHPARALAPPPPLSSRTAAPAMVSTRAAAPISEILGVLPALAPDTSCIRRAAAKRRSGGSQAATIAIHEM